MMRLCTHCGESKPLEAFGIVDRARNRVRHNSECKACCVARARRYYEQHRAERKAYARAHYQRNRERLLALCRDWQQRNPDKVLEYGRRRRAKPEYKAYVTAYHIAHGLLLSPEERAARAAVRAQKAAVAAAARVQRASAQRHRVEVAALVASPLLSYPYLRNPVGEGAELLMTINALIPKGVSNAVRADACQELALAVLSGEIALTELAAHVGVYVRRQLLFLPSRFRYVYLDAQAAHERERVEFQAQRLAEAWGAAFRCQQ